MKCRDTENVEFVIRGEELIVNTRGSYLPATVNNGIEGYLGVGT